jgi:hypothetical protein
MMKKKVNLFCAWYHNLESTQWLKKKDDIKQDTMDRLGWNP